jgi:hypothetical protein
MHPVTVIIGTSSTENLGKRRRACTGKSIDTLLPKRSDSPRTRSLPGARLERALPLETRGPETEVSHRARWHSRWDIIGSPSIGREHSVTTIYADDLQPGDVVDYHGHAHQVTHIDRRNEWAGPIAFDDAGWAWRVGHELVAVHRAA